MAEREAVAALTDKVEQAKQRTREEESAAEEAKQILLEATAEPKEIARKFYEAGKEEAAPPAQVPPAQAPAEEHNNRDMNEIIKKMVEKIESNAKNIENNAKKIEINQTKIKEIENTVGQ